MTENEAISRIKDHMEIHRLKEPRAIYITVALSMAITALKEIQQYREIGTVEECREAVERQNPKRLIPVESGMFYDLGFRYKCPNCGIGIKVNNIYHYDVCKICGQKVSNKERGEE